MNWWAIVRALALLGQLRELGRPRFPLVLDGDDVDYAEDPFVHSCTTRDRDRDVDVDEEEDDGEQC